MMKYGFSGNGNHIQPGSQVGILGCSNSLPLSKKKQIDKLGQVLRETGLKPVFSDYLYTGEKISGDAAKEKAAVLMDFYRNPEIKAVFDVSGGDLANGILPYLDYGEIGKSGKLFWGYSDLTTVINAVYAKTGRPSVLYQVRNLVGEAAEQQQRDFGEFVMRGSGELFTFPYEFVQGSCLKGVIVGGNIRCFLKLAGTPYLPELAGRVLLLEAFSGGAAQMTTYLNQLEQMGVFHKVKGILLGTFTQMEQDKCEPDIIELVQQYAPPNMSIVKTGRIGHGADSRGILVGAGICICASAESI